ncbi:MAG: SH3 domain-containing protein [Bacteroidetes bacterium]|nr:SH3 domain-containing protein [Bacteroidota bacterium]
MKFYSSCLVIFKVNHPVNSEFISKVTKKSEPNANSQKLFTLHEGTKVNVLEKSSSWVKIKLPNGNVGWLNASDVEVI